VLVKAASVLFEGEVEIQTANGTSDNINALFGRVARAEQEARDLQAALADKDGSDVARDDKLARLVEEVQALREDMQTALDTFEARSIAARTTLAAEQMALGALIEEVATRCLPLVEFEAAPYVTARQPYCNTLIGSTTCVVLIEVNCACAC